MARVPETILVSEEEIGDVILQMEARAKEPKGMPLAALLEKLKQSGQRMIAAGYSYGDISELLKENKINIPLSVLRESFKEAGKGVKANGVQKPKRRQKNPVRSPELGVADETPANGEEKIESEEVKLAKAKGFNMVDRSLL